MSSMRACLAGIAVFVTSATVAGAPQAGEEPEEATGDTAEAPREADLEWPRYHEKDGNEVWFFQPQIERWDDYELVVATAALVVKLEGSDERYYGSIKVVARTSIDFETRRVHFGRREIRGMRFPDVDPETYARIRDLVPRVMAPSGPLVMSLDEIVAYLDIDAQVVPETAVSVQPPPIYHRERPAILVCFVGEPQYARIPDTFMAYAVNTAWTVILDPGPKRYFLLDGESWLTSQDLEHGPWEPPSSLPDDLHALPDDPEWASVREHVPGVPAEQVPEVIVTRQPAELIVTDGPPSLEPIEGTTLAWVSNTDADLFRDESQSRYYLLAAGRWFAADELDGPWVSAIASLPDDFARIPKSHPRSHVLASVPGTDDAAAAVLLASIPRKATVLRESTTIDVPYEGEPSFKPVVGVAGLEFADNTPYDVFRIDDICYCCHQGVWFTASRPEGPWVVAAVVPDEIYDIPSVSPKHDVTYVQVYDSDDATVTVGQTSGYTGQYIADGLLVFGIGYAISQADSFYLHYGNARPPAYGNGVRYDYYNGRYVKSAVAGGPYGGAGGWASYDPRSGRYARGVAGVTSDGRYASVREGYNPSTDRYAASARGGNPYSSWGRSVITDDDGNWARAGHDSGLRGSTKGIGTSSGAGVVRRDDWRGNSSTVGRGKDGDLYVGRNGSVYHRDADGNWQSRGDGGWNDIDRGPGRPAQHDLRSLDRDAQSRQIGRDRARGFNRSRTSRGRGRSGGGGRRR